MKLARPLALLVVFMLVAAACGSDDPDAAGADADSGTAAAFDGTLTIGAIPDQDPDILARTYELLTDYLEQELPGVTVEYVPAVNYEATVSAFGVGDLDLVWFGSVTGIQARLEVEGAEAIAQRDLDDDFTSLFIARADSGIDPIDDVAGLSAIAGRSLTFGSESSTSGRLMPQYFLGQGGVNIDTDLDGPVGFSGSHDATIELVQAGTYEVGALNSQVWDSRIESGDVDPDELVVLFRTPIYYNYHWVGQPDLDERLGAGATDAFVDALMTLDPAVESEAAILDAFGAERFIETESSNYDNIEAVAREIGLIR